MQRKVGIIGVGAVGASVAISTLHSGAADEVWLHDRDAARAEGEAMDLAHGAWFYPACRVRTVDMQAMRAAQVVVIAAGRGGRPEETRLDLLRDNARVARDIGRMLAGFGGTVVMVSNPVDVLVQVLVEASGLPPQRVLGTGTMLDSSRLRQMLGQRLHLSASSVHAQVVGEHGDSAVPLWSSADAGSVALRRWPGWKRSQEPKLAEQVRRAAYEVIQRKGYTNHAIGLVTARLLRCLLRDEQRVLTVSRWQQGAAGLQDVALSLPTIVGREGGARVLEPAMDDAEQEALARSAAVLRAARASIGALDALA
ncbi:MAG: L-lactate dehydrogenase [Burkholderiales bacterium]|nr:L-lactate dehydrogenase [Burkholderiales bacterium]